MANLNYLEQLPVETLLPILEQLSTKKLVKVCALTNTYIKSVCQDLIYPDLTRKIGQNKDLPYEEPDPYKKFILTQAIYGSDKFSARLCHPNWVCLQALKFNNMSLYYKYIPHTSDYFPSMVVRYAARAGNKKIFNEGFMDRRIEDWFDQVVTNEKEFLSLLEEYSIKGYTRVDRLSPNVLNNIVQYGSEIYADEVVDELRPLVGVAVTKEIYQSLECVSKSKRDMYMALLKFGTAFYDSKFVHIINSYEAFEYLPVEILEEYLENINKEEKLYSNYNILASLVSHAWNWNRWDLWKILQSYQLTYRMRERILEMGGLSTIALSILYGQGESPFYSFAKEYQDNLKGYLPYVKFCKVHNLPTNPNAIKSGVELGFLINNKYMERVNDIPVTITRSAPNYDRYRDYGKLQFDEEIKLPQTYYIEESTLGKVKQLASRLSGDEIYYGWVISMYDNPPFSLRESFKLDQAILWNNPVNAGGYFFYDSKDKFTPERYNFLNKLGPIFYGGKPRDLLDKDSLAYKLCNIVNEFKFTKETFQEFVDRIGLTVKEIDQIKPLALSLVWSYGDIGRIELVNTYYPEDIPLYDQGIILDMFTRVAGRITTIDDESYYSIFDKLDPTIVGKIIPGMIAINMLKSNSELPRFFNWLQSKDKFELNAQYTLYYCDCICKVGLDFLNKTCTASSIRKALQLIVDTPAPIEHDKYDEVQDLAKSLLV